MQRLFIPADLTEGAELVPTEAQAHYLAHVLRLAVGAPVAVFNGRDGEWLARIAALHRNRATLAVNHQRRQQQATPPLHLVFAPLKRDATDLLVRQATELGVTALHPVATTRTNTGRINPDRMAAIAQEAAEQCERLDLPAIASLTDLPALLTAWPRDLALAAAIERGPACPTPAAQALLIGPEGGFAPAELDALRGASFISPLHLGPLVLRAETAAIAGLTLLQASRWSTN